MIEQDFFKGKHRGWQNTLPEKWVGIALDLLDVAPEECMGLKEVVFSLVRKRSRQSNIAWSCLPGKRSVEYGKSRNKVGSRVKWLQTKRSEVKEQETSSIPPTLHFVRVSGIRNERAERD
jgi:hypothetical protein